MAKITIAGNAVIVTGAMKLEELQTIKKYRPKALVLMGGEDNKEEVFRVGISKGPGSVNKYGAEFAATTHNEEGKATITIVYDEVETDDIKEFVAEEIGAHVMNLTKLEETLPAVIEEINAEKAQILDNITVVQ